MTWGRAVVLGFLIVLYFAIATVFIPDWALQLVASAARPVRDLVVLVVWAVGFGVGLYLLVWAQRRELI